MTDKKKRIISIILFILIFTALLLTATFTDLQVSQILTKNALPKGQYNANDFFGVTFECIGSSPMYIMLSFAASILFWYSQKCTKIKILSSLLGIVAIGGSLYACNTLMSDTMKYIFRHISEESDVNTPFITGITIFFAVIFTVLMFSASKVFNENQLKMLMRFAIATALTVLTAQIIVHFAKIPMGRMRYRAMNCDGASVIGGFDNFTRWYVPNGQKYSDSQMIAMFGTTDACKSFPSGHTSAAGISYTMIMLIDALNIKSKGKKALLWIMPIAFTGTVAISRIVVGAHFFSDVLIGGTVSFLCMLLYRQLLFGKKLNNK